MYIYWQLDLIFFHQLTPALITKCTMTFGSVYCANNIQIITELGRFEHLEVAHQVDMMNLCSEQS